MLNTKQDTTIMLILYLHPLNPSLCSQQQPSPWDCSTIPKLQLPAVVPSRGPVALSGVRMAAAKTV